MEEMTDEEISRRVLAETGATISLKAIRMRRYRLKKEVAEVVDGFLSEIP